MICNLCYDEDEKGEGIVRIDGEFYHEEYLRGLILSQFLELIGAERGTEGEEKYELYES